MSWNETLASSIAIIAWCSGTLWPLSRPLTALEAADCLAPTSLTICARVLAKGLAASSGLATGFKLNSSATFSSSSSGMVCAARASRAGLGARKGCSVEASTCRMAESGFMGVANQASASFADLEGLDRHAARVFDDGQVGLKHARRHDQVGHFLGQVDRRHRHHAGAIGVGMGGIIDEHWRALVVFDVGDLHGVGQRSATVAGFLAAQRGFKGNLLARSEEH